MISLDEFILMTIVDENLSDFWFFLSFLLGWFLYFISMGLSWIFTFNFFMTWRIILINLGLFPIFWWIPPFWCHLQKLKNILINIFEVQSIYKMENVLSQDNFLLSSFTKTIIMTMSLENLTPHDTLYKKITLSFSIAFLLTASQKF